jgi:hypothetical protein
MKSLTELMNQYGSDKGDDPATIHAHNYALAYEAMFAEMREKPIKMLEIGVADPRPGAAGASLKAFYDYFPAARIFGYDIVDASEFNNDRITTFKGDQASHGDLLRFIRTYGGGFHIIIDDGSHQDAHQQISLGFLFRYLLPGGFYVIEDCHVSPDTMRFAKQFKDTPKEKRRTDVKVSHILPEEYDYLCEHARVFAITDKLIIFRR